jgi:hypothetical protein
MGEVCKVPGVALSEVRAESYKRVLADKKRGPIAFVPVTATEKLTGINWMLGIAVANERGYTPIPAGLACFETYEAASDNADAMNRHLGLSDDDAFEIVASSMFGKRYGGAM